MPQGYFPPFHENFIQVVYVGLCRSGCGRCHSILIYFSGMGKYLGFTTLTSFMFTLTPAGLIIAYFVRFMTPALAPIEAGMTRINMNMDEASSMLGRSSWGSFSRFTCPSKVSFAWCYIVLFVDILKSYL